MNFFIKSENPNRKFCWDENLFFLPWAFAEEVCVNREIAFVALFCNLSVFDGCRDGAIACGFLCMGAIRVTALREIRFEFGEAMG
jgi:hypothetical protein